MFYNNFVSSHLRFFIFILGILTRLVIINRRLVNNQNKTNPNKSYNGGGDSHFARCIRCILHTIFHHRMSIKGLFIFVQVYIYQLLILHASLTKQVLPELFLNVLCIYTCWMGKKATNRQTVI